VQESNVAVAEIDVIIILAEQAVYGESFEHHKQTDMGLIVFESINSGIQAQYLSLLSGYDIDGQGESAERNSAQYRQ
jgi:hypothetical protein